MKPSEAIPAGRLLIRQSAVLEPIPILPNNYDLVLCAISWESRCAHAFEFLNVSIDQLHMIRFATSDREIDDRKAGFVKMLSSRTKNLVEVQLGRSSEYQKNIELLDQFISRRVAEAGRPIKLLVDFTCIPKSYLLALLGMGFDKGYFARFDGLYSEGNYGELYSTESASAEVGYISEGKWDSMAIPFFEADNPIPSSRDLLVTLGGEVGLTIPFLEKYEPNRLGIVMLRPSVDGYPLGIRSAFSEPNVFLKHVDVCNAVGVVQHAMEFAEATNEQVVTALAVGSKPHALGLGVACLGRGNAEVICRIPKRYTMLNVPASGKVMLYQIEDRFEPHAYFSKERRD